MFFIVFHCLVRYCKHGELATQLKSVVRMLGPYDTCCCCSRCCGLQQSPQLQDWHQHTSDDFPPCNQTSICPSNNIYHSNMSPLHNISVSSKIPNEYPKTQIFYMVQFLANSLFPHFFRLLNGDRVLDKTSNLVLWRLIRIIINYKIFKISYAYLFC